MAFYLRDQHIVNVSLDDDALLHINNVFEDRFSKLKTELGAVGKVAHFTYIIRFDNKGYRVFSLDELMAYFNQARQVERVLFAIESQDALASGRSTGAYLELCLDSREPNRCVLVSSSDDKDWAEASFATVHEVLAKYRTRAGLVRNPWTSFVVQIMGVILGFFVSLWISFKVSPNLKFENSFVISFLFIILIFSNIWGYANNMFMGFVWKLFPNVEFIRPAKARLHWILQAIVGSSAFAVVVYMLGMVATFVSDLISRAL
ncbi:hypothetical protein ACTJK6_20555 [Ralstonia sp. 22086]|uniref:hypothetical protein n=1 Tax=Ralstonia sp. 22086 TaxID=3453870 RepID=UPI003F83B0F1